MIVVTGAAGFIGSAIVWKLNELGHTDLVLCDDLNANWANTKKQQFKQKVGIEDLDDFLNNDTHNITAILHMGACSSTTETDMTFLQKNNVDYTKMLWSYCTKHNIPFVYASSAATYGDGDQGYDDKPELEEHQKLKPLNKYGESKRLFDIWALQQTQTPKHWAGLKFFNVYGPNESHKGRMASMVFHTFNQAKETKQVKLFKSHKEGYGDGGQLRDFVYVKDVVDVIMFFMDTDVSGIYNVGTGNPESFKELATQTMVSMGIEPKIEYIPMPEDLRDQYQYYTKAPIDRLRAAGYTKKFHTLKEGVADYVKNYLATDEFL